MIIRSRIFKRVTIVGVGLMGGSLGMAIKKNNLAREVVGLSQRQSTLTQAIKVGAIDIGLTDIKKAINNADLVVLAAPVDSIIKLLSTINPYLKRGCIVTDIGSAKAEIVECSEKILSNPGMFVGSHPLCGSEKKGVEYGNADLYRDVLCIMTPTENTSQVAKEKVKFLWTKIGAEVKNLSAKEHDEILAYVSHLPHILSYGLIESIPNEYLEFSSQGLKDTTRIAASSPQLWSEICMVNSKNILKSMDAVIKHLAVLRKAIMNRDSKVLIKHFSNAKEKRDGIK